MNTRLTNTKHVSLNESIAYVNSPQRELDEATEYALALEEVLLALCEELDIDPNALVEDLQTPERAKEMRKKIATSRERGYVAQDNAEGNWSLGHNYTLRPIKKYATAAKLARRRQLSHERRTKALTKQHNAERKDQTTMYGKGGKVVGKMKPVK